MRYCSLADLQKAISAQTLIWLSNDDPEATAIEEITVEWAIGEAEQVIDGYIRERYPVPFEQTPTLVKSWAVAIARHNLYCRRPDGQELPEAVVRTYKDALKMLELVRDRKISLGIAEGDQAHESQPANGGLRVRAPKKRFGDDMLGKFLGRV